MFVSTLYTGSYTCRVSFARRTTVDPINSVELTTNDFNIEEITGNFRACTVEPGRRDVFDSCHSDYDTRRLTSKEYYNASTSIKRMRNEDARKVTQGIKEIETNIPSVKTTPIEKLLRHIQ
ncbi:hypothetical protein F4703DRAFT_1292361 [Phycomyces blakesleeanus]